MIGYRITKYDPAHRDAEGAFLLEDWTSVSDIGRTIGGRLVTKQEYLEIEGKYAMAASQLLSDASINSMRVINLEILLNGIDNRIDDGLSEQCLNFCNDMIVTGKKLEGVIRGCLREYIWCRLVGQREAYLHFGYDYYMYVGLPKRFSTIGSMPQGIFIDEAESPYMSIDD